MEAYITLITIITTFQVRSNSTILDWCKGSPIVPCYQIVESGHTRLDKGSDPYLAKT
jgi:hypothetical protein